MQIRIDESDLKKITQELNKIMKSKPAELEQLLKDTTAHIEGEAKQKAPAGVYPKGGNRVGGWLKKNITKGKDAKGYFVNSNADYSIWVEYGNRWWAGKSFFRPAIENGIKYLNQEVKTRFKW